MTKKILVPKPEPSGAQDPRPEELNSYNSKRFVDAAEATSEHTSERHKKAKILTYKQEANE